ncbi:MAG TPA: hypothetical protein VMT29_18915 [Steroidobacteraceae bacterium]|nr:hypothetical protein [Steroidobacteraceae bacterium]
MRIRPINSWVAIIMISGSSAADPARHTSALGWLKGAWSLQSGDSAVEEWWSAPAGGMRIDFAHSSVR